MNTHFAEFMNEMESPFFTVSEVHKILQQSFNEVSMHGEAAALGLKIHEEIRKTVVEIVTLPLYSNDKSELQEQNLKTQLINDVSVIFEKFFGIPTDCQVGAKDLAGLVATNIIDPLLETAKEIDSCCQAIERLMSSPFDVEFPARTARNRK